MPKKKILVHMITNLDHGGAEAVLYQIVKGLKDSAFEQHVVYFYSGIYVEKFKELGIPTHCITGLVCMYDPVFFVRLFRTIKSLRPDRLHTLLWMANFLGRLVASWYRLEHIEVFHNMIGLNGFVRNWLDRLTARFHGKVVAVSPSIARSLSYEAPWLARPSVHVIKNGILLENRENSATIAREELGLKKNNFVIGTVGRFEHVKNHLFLLTVFALLYDQYPEARLVLIGTGSLESALRQRAYDLGIDDRVIFVVGQDARHYFSLFDCFIMTSLSEGISIALLEAMAYGVVPLLVAHDKKHDVIEHERNGLLIEDHDVQLCANTIEYVMKHPDICHALAQEAQKTVKEHFRAEGMIAEYGHIFAMNASEKQ